MGTGFSSLTGTKQAALLPSNSGKSGKGQIFIQLQISQMFSGVWVTFCARTPESQNWEEMSSLLVPHQVKHWNPALRQKPSTLIYLSRRSFVYIYGEEKIVGNILIICCWLFHVFGKLTFAAGIKSGMCGCGKPTFLLTQTTNQPSVKSCLQLTLRQLVSCQLFALYKGQQCWPSIADPLYLVMLSHSAVKRSKIPIMYISSPAQSRRTCEKFYQMTQKIDFPACLVCVYSEGPECQANNVQSSNICLRSDHRPKREIFTSQNRIELQRKIRWTLKEFNWSEVGFG